MTILKGVPAVLPPTLLLAIANMGHGDELVIADANFPAESVGACTPGGVVRCDGLDACTLLDALLQLLPLDETTSPCALMTMMPMHIEQGWEVPIWENYKELVNKHEKRKVQFSVVERFAFYERAKEAYVVVATGESALYANLLLKKGIIGSNGKDKADKQ
eukprot:m.240378 g.240378  ORF g.240378 m.240378 type:complete len:161 (+) comp14973_c0_seq1:107-589(+)